MFDVHDCLFTLRAVSTSVQGACALPIHSYTHTHTCFNKLVVENAGGELQLNGLPSPTFKPNHKRFFSSVHTEAYTGWKTVQVYQFDMCKPKPELIVMGVQQLTYPR